MHESIDYARRERYSPSMQSFREWLRASLDERGWTNGDLERASGVSNSIIWRWLADPPRRPTPKNLAKIAPHLGVAYEELMRLCGYLPGEAEFPARQDHRLVTVNARWDALNEALKDAILRLTGSKHAERFAI